MKAVLHDDESGVSEVIGTIMILGITVVLFSTIILWVTSIPTPTTQTRLDMESTLNPVYNAGGTEIAVNVTIRHLGGDYARTLRIWRDRFVEQWPSIARLGFDPTFRRMWEFYLAYSEAGFRGGYLNVWQFGLVQQTAR